MLLFLSSVILQKKGTKNDFVQIPVIFCHNQVNYQTRGPHFILTHTGQLGCILLSTLVLEKL